MVLVEKNNNHKNGSKNRLPSPVLNGSNNSNLDSPNDEERDKARVGKEYQAVCPEYLVVDGHTVDTESTDRALLVWSPSDNITDEQLDEYIQIAKDEYNYTGEQALGMLFWHKHDLQKAMLDLANFTPFPDEWTVEDKVLFEQAFTFHGKTFHRIRQMLPDKTMGSLVKYYYSWKKTRSKNKKPANSKEPSEPGSGHNTDTEVDDKQLKTNILCDRTDNKVQSNGHKRKLKEDDSNGKTSLKWTKDELLLAVEGVRKHGKNERIISEILGGSKTEAQVRQFFQTYKKKYNLDVIMKDCVETSGTRNDKKIKLDNEAIVSSLPSSSFNKPCVTVGQNIK